MRIVVDVNHPAHVHYFKNIIWEMQEKGHEFLIASSEKDVTQQLLDAYGFDYVGLGSYGNTLIKKAINVPMMDLKMYRILKDFRPDICLGAGSIRAAHTAFLLGSKSIHLESTEHSVEQHLLYLPFASTVLTPVCFKKNLGKKQLRFDGYEELLYLHPNYFTPNPAVLDELGLSEGDPFIIVRFVSWQASHDVGHHGIRDKVGFVKALEQYGRVLITSEGALPEELQTYQIKLSPEKLHDLLYYAALYVGEGGTTASEAAVLGTPSIYVSSLVMGYLIELEETYNLLYSFIDSETALDKAIEILQDPMSKEKWKVKREQLLKDKIDVTAFMVWFIENYPSSFIEMKEHPEA